MANGNPFYVHPGADMGPGLMGLAETVGKVGERKKAEGLAQEAKDKELEIQKEITDAMESKDAEKIRAVAAKYPAFGKNVKDIMEMKLPGDSSVAYKDALFSTAIDPSSANQGLENMRTQFAKDGIDAQEQEALDKLQSLIGEKTPEELQKGAESALALIADKDEWGRYTDIKKGTGPDSNKDLSTGYKTFLSAMKLGNSSENYNKYQKNKAKIAKEIRKQKTERPEVARLMAEGWVPSTRITEPMLDAYEAAATKAAENGKPFTSEDLYSFEFNAQRNRATGRTAGSRLVLARKQNIEAANGLLKDMKATSAKLNYSPVKFIASIEKFKKGQMVDPIFTEYMTQRADSLFILGNALKQNGLTDKSIEVEEEAFSPTLSPEAFNAWYNTQLRALNRAAEEMNRDFKYGIETHPTFPAGQAGASTEENPTAMTPEQERVSQELNFDSQGKIIP